MEAYVGSILAVGFNWAPVDWMPCDGRLLQINQYAALYSLLGIAYGGDGRTTFGIPDLRGRVALGYGQGAAPLSFRNMGATGGAEASSQVPPHTHGATGTTTVSGTVTGSVSLPVTANVNLPMTVTGPMLGTTETAQQDVPFPDSMVADVLPGSNTKVYAKPATPATTTIKMATMTSTGTLTGAVTGTAAGPINLGLTGTTVPTAVTVQSNPGGAPIGLMNPFGVVNYIICVNGLYPPRP